MKIELKNVKHAAFASQETDCFQASVYIDGARAGEVSNEGHGGPNRYEPWALQTRINEYAKTLPSVHYHGMDLPQDADTLIGDALNAHLQHKANVRLCKGKTVARLPGQTYKEGEWSVFKAVFSPEVKAKIIAKHGEGVVFLNEQI